MNNNKLIGSIMLLIGTTLGAGMLQFQIVSAPAGFLLSTILLVLIGIISIITGLMIVEVNLAMPINASSFSSMAEQTLGQVWKIIVWFVYLFLLYSIDWAYVSGGSSLINSIIAHSLKISLPSWIGATAFTLFLGSAIFLGTKTVDSFNRSFMGLKAILLFLVFILILPRVEINKLFVAQNPNQADYLWAVTPIFVLAFFNQNVIPSLRLYIGDNVKSLKQIVIYGAIICGLIYLLWLTVTLGVVPMLGDHSFTSLAQNHGSVGEFMQIMYHIIHSKWAINSINWFSSIALTTSFLGVTLSLFDFLADGLKIPDTNLGRLKTSFITLLPPLVLAIFYPKGFALALNYAAIFITIFAIILPPLMVYYLRKNPNLKSPYRIFGGNILLAIIFLFGIVCLILPILAHLNLLPHI
jgi:aromatic amino acid transport protein